MIVNTRRVRANSVTVRAFSGGVLAFPFML